MIRIYKPKTAPAKLRNQGRRKTKSYVADYNKNRHKYETGKKRFSFSSNIYADPTVKDALIEAQYGKCCFCERLVGGDGDVEHFRPKRGYCQNKGERIQRPGYYWLAYNWDNLYLSCSSCNQRQKRNLFPLSDPQKRAHLHNNDISQE
jgi:5-methylcytosine-specific restriction endonuclease McrA